VNESLQNGSNRSLSLCGRCIVVLYVVEKIKHVDIVVQTFSYNIIITNWFLVCFIRVSQSVPKYRVFSLRKWRQPCNNSSSVWIQLVF